LLSFLKYSKYVRRGLARLLQFVGEISKRARIRCGAGGDYAQGNREACASIDDLMCRVHF
jgi:hypothetical protein